MTPQEQIAHVVKTLRNQAKDNLAMADYIESLKLVDVPQDPELPSNPSE